MLSYEQIKEIVKLVSPCAISEKTGLSRQAIYNLSKKSFNPQYETVKKFSDSFKNSWPLYEWVKENLSNECLAQDLLVSWQHRGEFYKKPSLYTNVPFPDKKTLEHIDNLWSNSNEH